MKERKKIKSLRKYSEELQEATPSQLSDILTEMTVDYAEVCDMLLPLERAKMNFWLEHKNLQSDKPISDKTLEMMWMSEKDEKVNGILQKRMEIYKKALEKMTSNVKAILREKEHESRNQF